VAGGSNHGNKPFTGGLVNKGCQSLRDDLRSMWDVVVGVFTRRSGFCPSRSAQQELPGCRTRIFTSREFGKFSAKCREGTHLQRAQKRGLTADGRMDADGLRRLGRHFAEEVQRELPVGLVPAGDSASYLRPSACIRG